MRSFFLCLAVVVVFPLYGGEFPERDLRGYGRLSATFERGDDSSLLTIRCESVDKAKVVHAKYLSDLQIMGGVQKADSHPIYKVESQGYVVALRHGETVYVIAAKTPDNLLKPLADRLQGPMVFEPEVEVPMLLDAWDKYAFRAYHRPWHSPGQDVRHAPWVAYDTLKADFDYAEKWGHIGWAFFVEMHTADTARNMTNQTYWDWAVRAATRRNLPVVIHTIEPVPDSVSWVANRYREQVQQPMPGFVGSFHSVGEPHHGGVGRISWNATTAKDWELRTLSQLVNEYSKNPNVIDFLDPQGEACHGDYDIFTEFGPTADTTFREFLRKKYGTLEAVSLRWHGDANRLKSWDEVQVPEVASFAAWNETAIDLQGDWKVRYEPARPADAPPATVQNTVPSLCPDDWFAADCDDSDWTVLPAPGHDRAKFSRRDPAVFRRTIDVPEAWLQKHPRVWLYVWDLNQAWWYTTQVWVNGNKIVDEVIPHPFTHWCAPEATATIKPGKNTIALRLPAGFLGYKVYLGTEPPLAYPAFDKGKNAQWADFTDWRCATRHEVYRRGLQMIRENDDKCGINMMAPDAYASGLKPLAAEYGARFYNTGLMGVIWVDNLPMMMRSEGLPFALEPGAPAKDLAELKNMFGLYLTEGVNAIQYFINLGNIIWDTEQRQYFEENRELLTNMGRVHVPKAETALYLSERAGELTWFPWNIDQNVSTTTGILPGRYYSELLPEYPIDAVGDLDFERGIASAYKVILDSNTTVMTEKTVTEIERWVREGGIFVTYLQTGRHTPEERDAWPISRLSGYEVVHIDPLTDRSGPVSLRPFGFAPDQDVFDETTWKPNDKKAFGLSLKKAAPECKDLLLWEDGTVAAGIRPLGKGYVVHLGLRYLHRFYWHGNREANARMYNQLLAWAKLERQPGRAEGAFLRCNVSNNGLYDVWVLWNNSDKDRTATLRIDNKPVVPEWGIRIKDGTRRTLAAESSRSCWNDVAIAPQEVEVLATPRGELLDAPRRWFELQREWWKGGKGRLKPFEPLPEDSWTRDLTNGWKIKYLPDGEQAPDDFPKAEFDDSSWIDGKVDVWAVPEEQPYKNALMRRRFTVPAEWKAGEIDLYIKSWNAWVGMGKLRVWLDGREILKPDNRSLYGVFRRITAEVEPGKSYILAIEVFGEGVVPGLRGNAWMSFVPKPTASIDLAGTWTPSKDALAWTEPVQLPGKWKDSLLAKRTITIPTELKDKKACFRMRSLWGLTGVIVNGHYVRRHHHVIGEFTHLNITPFLLPGENEIEIVSNMGPSTTDLSEIGIDFYDSEFKYP